MAVISVNKKLFLMISFLMVLALACGFSDRVSEVQEQVSVMGTAQAAANQAGGVVQTVVAEAPEQGSLAVATLQASEAPDITALREKYADIQPDMNGNYTVTITDDEVNQVMRLRPLITEPDSQIQVQAPVLSFTGGNIVVEANVLQPLSTELGITLKPTIVDGQLSLDLQKASLGGLPVPGPVLSITEGAINNSLDQALKDVPAGFQLLSVTLGEGTLTIVARPS